MVGHNENETSNLTTSKVLAMGVIVKLERATCRLLNLWQVMA